MSRKAYHVAPKLTQQEIELIGLLAESSDMTITEWTTHVFQEATKKRKTFHRPLPVLYTTPSRYNGFRPSPK